MGNNLQIICGAFRSENENIVTGVNQPVQFIYKYHTSEQFDPLVALKICERLHNISAGNNPSAIPRFVQWHLQW